jgi:hypothetical protein
VLLLRGMAMVATVEQWRQGPVALPRWRHFMGWQGPHIIDTVILEAP